MSKTIVIFGAGTGLGAATARRFGREGYAIGLVARRQGPLDELAATLDKEGIEAAVFPADLSDTAAAPALVERISERFRRIDVVEYAPVSSGTDAVRPASQLSADFLRPHANLLLHTPVEIARAVLPQMIERGNGGFLLGIGLSAVTPSALPGLGGATSVMAAARHWMHGLHSELADKGVYAGTLAIGAMIEGSLAHQEASEAGSTFSGMPVVSAAHLADLYWDMLTKRDQTEQLFPSPTGP
ncbi:SDR family NAD(P)-dependent oxidoreductase [Streptomyces sp. NPDC057199]|uniref:SDR family NAD(P)-dependent oxidoreductase n=1 Tax=Streptomyces sp. NPDC057199 TaxID=3346047 RepID=UPI00364442CF